jgi:hypothetical protein
MVLLIDAFLNTFENGPSNALIMHQAHLDTPKQYVIFYFYLFKKYFSQINP